MHSLRQQILFSMIASLVLLAVSFILIFGYSMQERAISAAIIKAQSDMATCSSIIDLQYPGEWKAENGSLFKGQKEISHNNELVDSLSELTGDSVTVFLNDTRVATTIRGADGERAIGTRVSDSVAQKVLNKGEVFLGEANVVGEIYQTAYEPLRDAQGNIVGMFYVGISRSYTQEMIYNTLWHTAALGGGITLIVALLAWLFVERVIIRPLREITVGTRDLATGRITEKVDISGPKEIGDLALAFNQMIERLENITKDLELHANVLEENPEIAAEQLPEPIVQNLGPNLESTDGVESQAPFSDRQEYPDQAELPKGLNRATLKQITDYLIDHDDFVSAEDVAEGVKLTRVTVRRYLEYLEQQGALISQLKYGAVGRPVRIWSGKESLREGD
ncbi:cache domain-containing protein [Desulfitobacterium sp.]|uniref:cache domain-containing protein n=1 Tax=Desulfitobacterium sp. TaxID=49981 RepID=UPI002B1FD956|nr:cache domain-containing protein [Desulfitobacterium sp.]MEA4902867.1 cache domain-containing protein [Desulfitobacterium sp.]